MDLNFNEQLSYDVSGTNSHFPGRHWRREESGAKTMLLIRMGVGIARKCQINSQLSLHCPRRKVTKRHPPWFWFRLKLLHKTLESVDTLRIPQNHFVKYCCRLWILLALGSLLAAVHALQLWIRYDRQARVRHGWPHGESEITSGNYNYDLYRDGKSVKCVTWSKIIIQYLWKRSGLEGKTALPWENKSGSSSNVTSGTSEAPLQSMCVLRSGLNIHCCKIILWMLLSNESSLQ